MGSSVIKAWAVEYSNYWKVYYPHRSKRWLVEEEKYRPEKIVRVGVRKLRKLKRGTA